MAKVRVPTIAIVVGEGSSGGALAISVADKIVMLENAIYSILSPEGYSSILWKDSSRYKEAAEKMKLTAKDLYELKVIDKIVEESDDYEKTAMALKNEIVETMKVLKPKDKETLLDERYIKYRNMGEYIELGV